MRYSENFQGLFSCQTQVIVFSEITKPVDLKSAGFCFIDREISLLSRGVEEKI